MFPSFSFLLVAVVVGQCFCAENVLTVCSLRHMNRRKETVQLRLLFRYQKHRNQFFCHSSAISHRGRLNNVIIIAAKWQLRCTAKFFETFEMKNSSQRKESFSRAPSKKEAKLTFLMPNENTKSLQLRNIKKIASQHFCLPLSSPITLVYILYSCERKGGEAG